MRKLPIATLSTTVYMTETSKREKTHEKKQAKKKELDTATLWGRGFGGWAGVWVSLLFSQDKLTRYHKKKK